MTILNLPTFTEQTEKTPEQKLLESLQQMQIERPSVPAAEVPRFTRYGNRPPYPFTVFDSVYETN